MLQAKTFQKPFCALAGLVLSGALVAGPAWAANLKPKDAPDKCGAHSPQLQVTVHGVTPTGLLTVELYNPSTNAFLRKASRARRVRVAAGSGTQTVCLNLKGPGRFAVAAYHDKNGNRKLDRKLNQLPSEPFALSNNQPLKLRMPKFEEAAFNVPASGGKVDIRLETR